MNRLAGLTRVVVGVATLTVLYATPSRSDELDSAWRQPSKSSAGWRFAPDAQISAAPVERWRIHLPGGVTGTPSIVDGTVYAASFGGDVVAVDLQTGVERWHRSFGTALYPASAPPNPRQLGFFGGPAVHGHCVIVASDRVRCLDRRTGDERWAAPPLRSQTGQNDYFWGSIVVVGDLALIGSGSGGEIADTRGRVTAYAINDGEMRWSFTTVPAGANGGGVLSPVTVDDELGIVYAATGGPYQAVAGENPGTDTLYALRLADGQPMWSDQVHAHDTRRLNLNGAPVLVGGVAAVAGKDGFRAWDRLQQTRLWYTQLTPLPPPPTPAGPTNGPEGGPLASDGQRLYGLSNGSSTNPNAFAFVAAAMDPCTGTSLWETALPSFAFAPPAVAGGTLLISSFDGKLRGLNTSDGSLVFEVSLRLPGAKDGSACGPAVAQGAIVVGTGSGPFLDGDSLVCLR